MSDEHAQTAADALEEAKKAANGPTGLARLLDGDLTPQAISQWRQVPAERVIAVEKVTGVSRSKLRPDLYPEAVADAVPA